MKVVIKRKDFEVGWTGVYGRSTVAVTEKLRRKVVRAVVSKECADWLSSFLWELGGNSAAQAGEKELEERRWRVHQAVVVLSVEQNPSGRYVQLVISPLSEKGRPAAIFIPAGRSGNGWRAFAESTARLLRGTTEEN